MVCFSHQLDKRHLDMHALDRIRTVCSKIVSSKMNYWTEKKLIEDYSKFSNIATSFGITRIPESEP
jgi:hypothetical protein